MKLLAINTEKTWRGGERQTYYHVKGFLEKQISVEVLCLRAGPLSKKLRELDVRLHEVSHPLAAWWFLVRHGSSFDWLHAHTAKGHSLAFLSRFFHKTPICYTRRVDFKIQGLFAQWKYQKTECLIALSNAIAKVLASSGIRPVHVIPSIAEFQQPNVERAKAFKLEISPDKKIIATTAALVEHKDPLTLVKSIAILSTLRSDFICLHFGEGPLHHAVEAAIQHHQLESSYRLMGFYPAVEDFFPVFDAFVMSSQEEGLGSSVLDAFLYRVPVVSTDAGGLAELVEGKGLLAPIKDAERLAQQLNRILDESELRNDLSKTAYAYVLKYHSINKITDDYLQALALDLLPKQPEFHEFMI